MEQAQLESYRTRLDCRFERVNAVFADCVTYAAEVLTEQGVWAYLDCARLVNRLGRGDAPVLSVLAHMPDMARVAGETVIAQVQTLIETVSRTPNGRSIPLLLEVLPAVVRVLGHGAQVARYLALVQEHMERTTVSIHGSHAIIPSESLPCLLRQSPYLVAQLSLQGLAIWMDFGLRHYGKNPQRQAAYFNLDSADSQAVFNAQRQGVLLATHERLLQLYGQGFWGDSEVLIPFAVQTGGTWAQTPYFDAQGMRLPEVLDERRGVAGVNRYRAMLAHMHAHRRWSSPVVADNYSPMQRLAIECFEDSRVEWLAIQQYAGLRGLWQALHPQPREEECDQAHYSCLRHRMAMMSYALLNPQHGYQNAVIGQFAQQFAAVMRSGSSSTRDMVQLGLSFVAKTRQKSDQRAQVYFENTEVDYRDDNRHLWTYIEQGDEEEVFDAPQTAVAEELSRLPPKYYPEWDYEQNQLRPDWVSVYEHLHPSGEAALIDRLLDKHTLLIKQLKRVVALLKPQYLKRVRYQEQGTELDLDVAIRAMIDYRVTGDLDRRLDMAQAHDGRDIAVLLLLDLSESLNHTATESGRTLLELSQEAVSLLAAAVDDLGDKLAIAGFSSNTRHEVRYQHIKGFSEHWGCEIKSRLAAMQAGYSTRMGAGIRHAGHYLRHQVADKKLLLILTDGEPADIDVSDVQWLTQDAKHAVAEITQSGIATYCINLDSRADEYVKEVFGHRYTVIDHVHRLPERLTEVFLRVTR